MKKIDWEFVLIFSPIFIDLWIALCSSLFGLLFVVARRSYGDLVLAYNLAIIASSFIVLFTIIDAYMNER